MEIKTKYKIGDRLCFIENGAMVYDDVESVSAYVYEDGKVNVYYYFKHSQRTKNECDVIQASFNLNKNFWSSECRAKLV